MADMKCKISTILMIVVKLKEQLLESEKEIHQLGEGIDGVSSKNSSISSVLSMEANIDPVFQREFGYDDVFYVGEDSYINRMELENLYM
ncbi:hypothetical protein V6N12_022050 [Hibiscus sabdariffa]|uniref:Uncharacterized protein n=1 Tax=Hibiscus sabdariffa TaxID=183260 RepID=A0ABR2FU30_9ROSI